MCTRTSLLVLVKHTKRATNILKGVFVANIVESLVGFCSGISRGTAEAADTRSIAIELLSQNRYHCLIAHTCAHSSFTAHALSSSMSKGFKCSAHERLPAHSAHFKYAQLKSDHVQENNRSDSSNWQSACL